MEPVVQEQPTRRRISYSQFAMWANCPKQWKLAYVDKLKPRDSSIHLIFGTAIHSAIQEWVAVRFSNKPTAIINAFDINGVFKDTLFNLFKEQIAVNPVTQEKIYVCDQDTLKEFYLDGCAILSHVKKHKDEFFPTSGYELVGCEIPLHVELPSNVDFIAYIDIVIKHKRTNKIFIYDLKTSKSGWFHEKKDSKKINQVLLYKEFYSRVFDIALENIFVSFIILKRKVNENSEYGTKRIVKFEPAHGSVSMKKMLKEFNAFIDTTFGPNDTILVDALIAQPSKSSCRWCPFRENKDLCKESFY
jgi:hypothetical protein